jgi:hypothetical protein
MDSDMPQKRHRTAAVTVRFRAESANPCSELVAEGTRSRELVAIEFDPDGDDADATVRRLKKKPALTPTFQSRLCRSGAGRALLPRMRDNNGIPMAGNSHLGK